MADDIDLRKCADFYDHHVDISVQPSALNNLTIFGKNHVFHAEIVVSLANLNNCTRWLMTLNEVNVQNLMTVISVSH